MKLVLIKMIRVWATLTSRVNIKIIELRELILGTYCSDLKAKEGANDG